MKIDGFTGLAAFAVLAVLLFIAYHAGKNATFG